MSFLLSREISHKPLKSPHIFSNENSLIPIITSGQEFHCEQHPYTCGQQFLLFIQCVLLIATPLVPSDISNLLSHDSFISSYLNFTPEILWLLRYFSAPGPNYTYTAPSITYLVNPTPTQIQVKQGGKKLPCFSDIILPSSQFYTLRFEFYLAFLTMLWKYRKDFYK